MNPHPRPPSDAAFVDVGTASGFGFALLGSIGPLAAPFFLAYRLARGAYIGTEAACALSMHAAKTVAYENGNLLSVRVVVLAAVLTTATLAGAWDGKCITDRMTGRLFTRLAQIGLQIAGTLIAGPKVHLGETFACRARQPQRAMFMTSTCMA